MLKHITSLFLLGTPPPLHLSTPPMTSVAIDLPWKPSLPCRMPFGGSNSPTQSLSTWSTASKLPKVHGLDLRTPGVSRRSTYVVTIGKGLGL
jgi:hypothetical protein